MIHDPPSPPAKDPPIDPALLRVIEAMARADARRAVAQALRP